MPNSGTLATDGAKDATDEKIADAAEIAAQLHAGQVDRGGQPYIGHLSRVAAILQKEFPRSSADAVAAAWLHDALEDTDITADGLRQCGISERTIEIVQRLTRYDRSVAYLDWINQIIETGDLDAIRVKLADNIDNRDPSRDYPERRTTIAEKYEPAAALLSTACQQKNLTRAL